MLLVRRVDLFPPLLLRRVDLFDRFVSLARDVPPVVVRLALARSRLCVQKSRYTIIGKFKFLIFHATFWCLPHFGAFFIGNWDTVELTVCQFLPVFPVLPS